jgi:arylsulfatase A-like enzyme
MIRKIITSIMLIGTALSMTAQIERPKLVVGITVDQMRWDYLYYYYNQFGEGGLKRLVDEGFSCENTMINYVPTVTAIGHTSIYTGSVPALTGIAGNDFIINGKSTYCTQDDEVQSVGSNNKDGQMSPHYLLASGIGTVMKIATDYKAKVIGIALKDRAAILPAGHGADAAYWWDTAAGHYVSSTYYMKELPKWVQKFNKENQQTPGKNVKGSVEGVTMTFKMAEAAVENEQLGQDDTSDLLAVSVSSTDYIGHAYGTRGQENHDVYMQLDKDLAHFFNYLDQKVGKGNYLIWLSADHGGMHNYNLMNQHNIAAGAYAAWTECDQFNEKFKAEHGFKAVTMVNADRIYLNHQAIDSAHIDLQSVKKEVAEFLKQNNNRVYRVVDYENIMNTTLPEPIRERIINGYNPDRSGDLYVITIPGTVDATPDPKYIGTGHSVWNPYDSHIPLVFMGWHIKKGQTSTPTRIVDIAPTICELLHIQMPSACVGDAINEVIHQ